MKKIYLCHNNESATLDTVKQAKAVLSELDIQICSEYSEDCDFIITVGGDGVFLTTMAATNCTSVPVLGINTGHLGIFQELQPDNLNLLKDILIDGKFILQKHKLIEAQLMDGGKLRSFTAVNDIGIRDQHSRVVHLVISIGDHFIENFSGDGVLVASAAGSTAYNYSLGGSIVDSRLDLLQLTPMAPINNTAYRSFTNSLILPGNMTVGIKPHNVRERAMAIMVDGAEYEISNMEELTVTLSDRYVNIVRLPDYDFWGKVKSKFL